MFFVLFAVLIIAGMRTYNILGINLTEQGLGHISLLFKGPLTNKGTLEFINNNNTFIRLVHTLIKFKKIYIYITFLFVLS